MKPPLRHVGAVINTYLHLRGQGLNRHQAAREVCRALSELFDLWLLEGIERQKRRNKRQS